MEWGNPSVLYCGTFGGGVFKSTNLGLTWTESNSGLGGLFIRALVIDPSDPMTIYAGASEMGVFKTTDGGASWTDASSGLEDFSIRSLVIDPLDTSVVYAGTFSGGVFKSVDGGAGWISVNNGLSSPLFGQGTFVFSLVVNPVDPMTVYAGTGSGVFKSSNVRIPVKPATQSGESGHPVGAKRRWGFHDVSGGRFESM